jgi:RNA polymerase primary sigma factor
LAKWVAKQFVGRGLEREDLNQAAMLGLMRAAQSFDPSRGTRFSTYASVWARQFVRRAIEKEARTIRVPSHVLQSLGRRKREAERGETTPELTACEAAALRALGVAWLDHDEEQACEPADTKDGPVEAAGVQERNQAIHDAVGRLPGRLRTIVERRFGLGCEVENLREIGARLGLTGERVRQLEAEALVLLSKSRSLPRALLR